jgi:hypothetical protein
MPFSSVGDTIEFIYGVINWKHVGVADDAPEQHTAKADLPRIEFAEATDSDEPFDQSQETIEIGGPAAEEPLELIDAVGEELIEPIVTDEADDAAEELFAEGLIESEQTVEADPVAERADAPVVHFSWEDGPLGDVDADELPAIELDENAGLADRLWAARETADAVKSGEGRTRVALYRALSLAYDFALAAQHNPDEYTELLDESGVKAQVRAPMTPIVKLVFGIDYDKARLTEFAAALSYALRQEVASGGFQDMIQKQAGGLKALVAAERQARRPEPKPDTKGEVARARLRTAPPISLEQVPADEEFAVVVTRRGPDGRHEAVAVIEDQTLVERAIRAAS